MRLRHHFIAMGLAVSPVVAAAQPVNWIRYQVPDTGAAVDLPSSIFTDEAGKPESGYGARFLTSDRRADLTVQSVPNDAGFSPAVFLARKNPPRDIVYKRVHHDSLSCPASAKEKFGTTAATLRGALSTAC